MNRCIRLIARMTVAVSCALGVQHAYAQAYPIKPVRIIVPYPAGGVVDALIRGV